MASFFVGQRVRIKWSKGFPELKGEPGRVVRLGNFPTTQGNIADLVVAPDAWGSEWCPYEKATRFTPFSYQVEPIIPEGYQPCGESYEELMDRLRSGVVA